MNFKSDKILQHIVNRVVVIADPDKIILFGSRATGKAKKDSDYDICVLKNNINRKLLLDKLYRIGMDAEAPVDIIVSTPRKFEKQKEKSYYVYYDVAKFGKVVYEKGR